MKKLFLLVLAIVLLTSCESNVKQRYTQQSPEIETYKKVIADYNNQNWEALASHYADTAKIMNNVTEENAQNVSEMITVNKQDATIFSSWGFLDEESEFEMVLTDKDQTWVNYWGIWEGTLKDNNKTYTIPAHMTARFVDGKIVKEFGYWDISKIMGDMMQLEQQAKQNAMEETAMEADTEMEKQ